MRDEGEMTTADYAEVWQRERGQPVPERGSAEWDAMYRDWLSFECADSSGSSAKPKTRRSKTLVIRRNSFDDAYLDSDGNWGEYRNAKRFKTAEAAERFAEKHDIDVFGLF
jgi:hypothetical protein